MIGLDCMFVVKLISVFCLLLDVKFFRCVKHSTIFCNVNYSNYVVHGAKVMPFVYNVLCELGSVVRVLVIVVIFVEPHAERSSSLANIFLVASGTF